VWRGIAMRSDKLFRSYCAAPQPRRHPDLDQIRLDQHGLGRRVGGGIVGRRPVGRRALRAAFLGAVPRRGLCDVLLSSVGSR
jgi:hypothetical protein